MPTKPLKNVARLNHSLTVTKQIIKFFHCTKCMDAIPTSQSPEKWARLNIGITKKGVQVWCTRHDKNVALLEWA